MLSQPPPHRKEDLTLNRMQHPIGTPFAVAATADDIVAGIDLTGTSAIVTGGHAGIGFEVTCRFYQHSRLSLYAR